VQRKDRQTGCEARCLVLPVEDQRGRQDDQGGPVEAAGLLFEQQVRQRLGGLAQAHVVGQNAGQVLFAQELQPGQSFGLVMTQFQSQSGRRIDVTDSLRRRQLLGERQDVALPAELPATAVVEFGQARCVETGDAQAVATGKTIEEIDQGRGKRFQTPGRGTYAQVVGRYQFDQFLVGDLRQQARIEPASVAPEQRCQQGGQRQAFALDDDPHVEVEPAVFRLHEIGIPGLDLEQAMPVIGSKLDLPADRAQAQHLVAHERRPATFERQSVGVFGRSAEGVQDVAGNFFETGAGQFVHQQIFARPLAFDANHLATHN
jgi:hypothetical protein